MSLNDKDVDRIRVLELRLKEIENKFHKFDLMEIKKLEDFLVDEGNIRVGMYLTYGYDRSKRRRIGTDAQQWLENLSYESLMRIKNTSLLRKQVTERKYDRLAQMEEGIKQYEADRENLKAGGWKTGFFSIKPTKEIYDRDLRNYENWIQSNKKWILNNKHEVLLLNSILDVADQYSDEISSIDREIKSIRQLAAAKKKESTLKAKLAKAAAVDEKVRSEVSVLKRQLKKTELCPYCCQPLGSNPHLDHIYPVSKGGLNLEDNLVFCCDSCNRAKSDKSLRQFCKEKGYDYLGVTDRLADMGKHV